MRDTDFTHAFRFYPRLVALTKLPRGMPAGGAFGIAMSPSVTVSHVTGHVSVCFPGSVFNFGFP